MLRALLVAAGLSGPLVGQTAAPGRSIDGPLVAAVTLRGEEFRVRRPQLLLVVRERFDLGHAVGALRGEVDGRQPVVLWCEQDQGRVEQGARVWGLPDDLPIVLGDVEADALTAWLDVKLPCWVLVDAAGSARWTGPVDPTSELALDRLRALRADALDSRWLAAEAQVFRQSTKSSGRLRYGTLVEGLRDLAPTRASSWLAEYRLLMNTVPQQAAAERVCVAGAFEALADHPLAFGRFVHRALFADSDMSDNLGPSFAAIDAVRARFPKHRTLEWATFRAAVLARRGPDVNRSALRLVELSKGHPAELLGAARELGAAARQLADPGLLRWAELALGFASESVPEACGFERERLRILLGGPVDPDAAADAMRRFAERAVDQPLARADLVVDCMDDELLAGRVDRGQLLALTEDFETQPVWPRPALVHARALALDAVGARERALAVLEPFLVGVGRQDQEWRDCRWLRDEILAR